jgi:hypothetical protein
MGHSPHQLQNSGHRVLQKNVRSGPHQAAATATFSAPRLAVEPRKARPIRRSGWTANRICWESRCDRPVAHPLALRPLYAAQTFRRDASATATSALFLWET